MSSTCRRTSALEQAPRRRAVGFARLAVEHPVVVLEREFGIDADHPGRRGELEHAVGARAVRERVLHLERGAGSVAHQRLELHSPERAARLLVARAARAAHHAPGQGLDLLLASSIVDRAA
jgi:hypothetical protein